jgi:hypothetical protein
MELFMKILKIVPVLMSVLSMLISLFKKKAKPDEVKKEEIKVKEEVKKGDVDKLNEELGWKG